MRETTSERIGLRALIERRTEQIIQARVQNGPFGFLVTLALLLKRGIARARGE